MADGNPFPEHPGRGTNATLWTTEREAEEECPGFTRLISAAYFWKTFPPPFEINKLAIADTRAHDQTRWDVINKEGKC